jgi:hypothetical protein
LFERSCELIHGMKSYLVTLLLNEWGQRINPHLFQPQLQFRYNAGPDGGADHMIGLYASLLKAELASQIR